MDLYLVTFLADLDLLFDFLEASFLDFLPSEDFFFVRLKMERRFFLLAFSSAFLASISFFERAKDAMRRCC